MALSKSIHSSPLKNVVVAFFNLDKRGAWRWKLCWLATLLALAGKAGATEPAKPASSFTTESLRGQAVWLAQALAQAHDVAVDTDAAQSQVVLRTADGALHPLVKDARGRGFWIDPALHDRDLELVVRRYPGVPFVQVIRVFSWHNDRKYELDYWCDICAIPMYERKPCECCQGETRIRERWVDDPLVEWTGSIDDNQAIEDSGAVGENGPVEPQGPAGPSAPAEQALPRIIPEPAAAKPRVSRLPRRTIIGRDPRTDHYAAELW